MIGFRRLRFDTVQTRLLAFFLMIAIPIGAITTLTAVVTYMSAVAAIESAQSEAADNFSIRLRIWYVGVVRSLIASVVSTGTLENTGLCPTIGNDIIRSLDGYRALLIRRADGKTCYVSIDPALTAASLEEVMSSQHTQPLATPKAVLAGIGSRYDAVKLGGTRQLVVYAREQGQGEGWEALLVVAPSALSRVFNVGKSDPDFVTALSTSDDEILFARGHTADDRNWLPADGVFPLSSRRWSASSLAGDNRIYYAISVGEPNLYVISSFLDRDLRAARSQFLLLLLAPLIALILLLVVFGREMNMHLVQWLRAIETTSRRRGVAGSGRISLSETMPSDIREVVTAFNSMIDEQEAREHHLQEALALNLSLTRELHHRVKNNLQVVQSYIGLAKQSYSGDARMALSEAECRVHVLSAAYRGALAHGEMRPVAIDTFLKDIVATSSSLLCRSGQYLSVHGETGIALSVDRAIPLGLLVVDRISSILHTNAAINLTMGIADHDDAHFEFEFKGGDDVSPPPRSRILAGLITQLQAMETTPEGGRHLGSWMLATQENDSLHQPVEAAQRVVI